MPSYIDQDIAAINVVISLNRTPSHSLASNGSMMQTQWLMFYTPLCDQY